MTSKTFCVLPWYGKDIYFDKQRACCLLPHNVDLDAVKADLLDGIETPACNKCWTVESQGKDSKRKQENQFLDYKLNKDIDKIYQDCIENKHQPLIYQITMSTLCNQACVTCSSEFSSKWADIENRMSITPRPTRYTDLNKLNVNYQTAKMIKFVGGEPLFDSKTFDVLDQLVAHNNADCFVSIVTNGSILLNNKHLDTLSKFTDLNICLSIDGVGKVFEYMRWPAKWHTLIQNIEQYKTVAKSLSVSYTISAVNAYYYNETVAWFQDSNLDFNHNVVYQPHWLSLYTMPVQIKQYLKSHAFFKDFCIITGKEISSELFLSRLSKQDQAKKISISDYMPELHHLLTAR